MAFRRFSLLLLSLASGLTTLRSTAEVALPEQVLPGLEPLLTAAMQQSPRMVSRVIDLEIAEQDRIGARAGLLPNFGGSLRYQEGEEEREGRPGFVPASKIYYDLTLTQPLFHWGERRNNDRIGEIRLQVAQQNHREAYRNLAQEVRQRYLALVVQKVLVARSRLYAEHATQQLRQAEDRHAKKIIADSALVAAQQTLERALIGRDRTEFDYEEGRLGLARLLGRPEVADADLPDQVPAIPFDLANLQPQLQAFLRADDLPTPEAQNLRRQIRIEELQYANQKTRLRPKLNLSAGVTQDEQSFTFNVSERYKVNYRYVGMTVNWTIFDGFAAQAGRRAALARKRKAEHEYTETADRLARAAQTQVRHLEFAARNMSLADRALHASEGMVVVRRDEAKRGLASETDVLLAELALLDARVGAYQARNDVLVRTCDFLGLLAIDPAVQKAPVQP